MNVAGLIFSNLHDSDLPALTAKRTMGAVPFGGRYRLIDFPLSAMVNAGLTHISIIAHHNYQSLMEHIGSGKDWDLARHTGGIRIVPPFSAAFANPDETYDSRMETLLSVRGLIDRITEEHVLFCDCDVVGVPDLTSLIEAHRTGGLPITLGTEKTAADDPAALHIWIARTDFLRDILREAKERHYTSFHRDVMRREMMKGNVSTHAFSERFFRLRSLAEYYRLQMLLATDVDVRHELLETPNRPIFTKIQNLPPVKYGAEAEVCDALIADGCVIEGSVKSSIIFPGVHVGRGCVVENAVLMENCHLVGHARVGSVILDKNVSLGEGVELHGHATLPFFVEEGRLIS